MVNVTFKSSFGQKDLKKTFTDEALIPERDPEDGVRVPQQSKVRCWCMRLGLALMLFGVVVGWTYLYLLERPEYFCGVDYMVREDDDMVDRPSALRHIEETVRVLEEEEVELINVPIPEFSDSDPADIVHDFNRRLTAYLDLSLNKCYVIPLNTSIVMPPKDFLELLVNIKAGTYLPQSYLVHEQLIVTKRLERVDQLGYFVNSLCKGRDTFKLERRDTILGREKREALSCRKIRHFENKFVVETLICEP
ncbi:integral membrane protein 2B [Esox lucius]|uniref:Integral membrane protein 2 n=1 Tax=Esox lucius TaxID=8010 RepID=A0A3P8YPA6_ESOLU|nr:integral membrane protein 2B [Esox lucius]